jgi:hypothetical protein
MKAKTLEQIQMDNILNYQRRIGFTIHDESAIFKQNKKYVDYEELTKRLKDIVFWRNGDLTCEQEVEKLLVELGSIESKDEKVNASIRGTI